MSEPPTSALDLIWNFLSEYYYTALAVLPQVARNARRAAVIYNFFPVPYKNRWKTLEEHFRRTVVSSFKCKSSPDRFRRLLSWMGGGG